ncbi:putative D-xylulose reductase A [Fusarium oxysporum f. sp. rapae]|uniref:Putative D-xylulose reductase A n=1 Tax=Fusarium oxysporum f. sp. rapae TaxID=485398 RepID=A0A8J5TSM4_FUSOX|nr:putative D-xylulose reductase A [Fusarium oxysporum f. sp. rapae]
MRAIVFKCAEQVQVEDRPIPTIQDPRDAIVKVTISALCGSDHHWYRGNSAGTRSIDGGQAEYVRVPFESSSEGVEWTFMPGIYSQEHVEGWKKVTDAVHELHHLGRVTFPGTQVQRELAELTLGPSPLAAKGGKFRNIPGGPGYTIPTEIMDPEANIKLYENV